MSHSTPQSVDRLRIAVLAGGESHERGISLKSGASVAAELKKRGHSVTLIDPAEVDPAGLDWHGFEAVFLALHGQFGEDGRIQRILEGAGIPYTGSDAEVSRLAFSKSAAKERFFQSEVPTLPYVLIHESDDAGRIQHHARSLGFPLVVKPDAQGSSLGVNFVHTPDELPQALSRCFHFDSFGVLETLIPGSEWTLGMLDDQALPLIQIESDHAFFDYKAKYQDEKTQYYFEFSLPMNVVKAIETAGRRACEALGTKGLVRVDLRLDKYNQPWVLEVNTIPGFTDHSLIPKAAQQAGIEPGELYEKAIRNCLAGSPVPQ